MKKLLFKTLLLCISVLIINVIIKQFITLPVTWGFERLDSKFNHFTNNLEKYNSLMIGSSRLYRQVDVKTFDSLNNEAGIDTKTFNFGVHTMSAADTYRFLSALSDSLQPGDLDYIFIELMNTNHVSVKNLGTIRSTFWYDNESVTFSVRSILNSNRSTVNKIYGSISHLVSYSLDFTNAGYISNYLEYQTVDTDSERYKYYLGPSQDGYFPLMDEMKDPSTDESDRTVLESRYEDFLKDTLSATTYKNISIESYSDQSYDSFNEYHYNYLKGIISKLEDKDIKVFILFPPRQTRENYMELIPILNQFPENKVLSVSSGKEYPELYLAKYSFDFGHLNNEGSVLFTKEISRKFRKKIK
ncbi:hypothetical protein OO013_18410 [Mangrovivirga sp. M17]|uniref:DUF1574 domain-containing protein n=1 Tax=Mangrovivirga halotolerans TaxID=2993936 RepID=A0ABT3RW37_9BACT|nr:hypothetical protein [Mangrovivirga halotolerans]MCX2745861.1 hypothetical protein [Mangrovivirga halotolerans]